MMRKSRSHSGSRQSLLVGPLRVRNDGDGSKSSHSRRPSGSGGQFAGSGTSRSRFSSSSAKSAPKYNQASHSTALGFMSKKRPSSGIGIRGRTDVPKDPRPISDKSYQHKCIRKLCEFLSENMYPHSISQKILQSPPSKDFFKIFEFLFSFFNPKYKIGSKPEDEIPRYLRSMGYPYTISKSSMFAVGSPHTWPHLLAALIWLVELVQSSTMLRDSYGIETILFPAKEDDFDSMSEDKMAFDYIEQTYAAFLSGEDTYECYDDRLSELFKEKYTGVAGGIDSLAAENIQLIQELEMLEKDSDCLQKLQQKKALIDSDLQHFAKYMNDLSLHKKAQEHLLKETEEEVAVLSAEMQAVDQENRSKQAIYENQEFTPADVERIRQNSVELQRQLDSLEKAIETQDSDIWKEEIKHSKCEEKLELKCAEYNKIAQSLKLIPTNAENAGGIDFELKPTYRQRINNDFENVIKPQLLQLQQQAKESLIQRESEQLQLTYVLEQRIESLTDAREEISFMDRNLKKTEDELDCAKEVFKREYRQVQDEIEGVQKEVMDLQKSSQMGMQSAQRTLRDTQKRCEQRQQEFLKTEREAVDFLQNVIQEVVDHKSAIRQSLRNVVEQSREIQRETKTETERLSQEVKKLRDQL